MISRRTVLCAAALGVAGCATSDNSDATQFGSQVGWTDAEPPYVLMPGDEIDLSLPSATELNRTLVVGPDGRVSLPLAGHLQVVEKSLPECEAAISAAYAAYLTRPAVELTLRRAAPAKIWVDGNVRTPGAFDLPSEAINAYQAVLLAGGTNVGSRVRQAILIRRGQDGMPSRYVIDVKSGGVQSPRVRRGDIIFVPRNSLGELAAFFGQVRDAMPIGFSYALNGGWN